jgi:hypothetical protein
VASIEGDKLVVSYYLSASEIWPDKKGWPRKTKTTMSEQFQDPIENRRKKQKSIPLNHISIDYFNDTRRR